MIKKKVKQLRTSRGLTKIELSRRSGLSRSEITLIESGQRQPRLSTLTKLAKGLGVSIKKFF